VIAVPRGARRMDVAGKTIMPGLWDMHTHVMQMEWAPVYLAAGVTTVRDMGNNLYFVVPFRDAITSRRILGPRLLVAGLVDGGGPMRSARSTRRPPRRDAPSYAAITTSDSSR
jgi:hypothetical protein